MTDKKQQLTAADIMKRDLVVVAESDSLQQALALMTDNHVTGLPVVNSDERCVGVISAFDILNYEQDHADLDGSSEGHTAQFFDPDSEQWETIRVGTFGAEEIASVQVQEVMACDLVAVQPETPIAEVARMMLAENVHRILVVGAQSRLFGIISATDFVRQYVAEH